jgi:hypothetical protein
MVTGLPEVWIGEQVALNLVSQPGAGSSASVSRMMEDYGVGELQAAGDWGVLVLRIFPEGKRHSVFYPWANIRSVMLAEEEL